MQTHFAPQQLEDPKLKSLEKILRSCVHCGFCTATCPTYVLGGDERDSPRGRIYLIKELLETGRTPESEDVTPIDHCLSCYACMTTCPSGVDYRRLVDHARELIEDKYGRGFADRALRETLAFVLPSNARFRAALQLAILGRPFSGLLSRMPGVGKQIAAMLDLAPRRLKPSGRKQEVYLSSPRTRGSSAAARAPLDPRVRGDDKGEVRRRVALLTGCAQATLAPEINQATIRLLNRLGVDAVLPKGEGCCGSLLHHLGKEHAGAEQMRANVDAWTREIEGQGLEAIVVTASGCGATIKDYGALLADDPAYAEKARRVSALAKDPSEFFLGFDIPFEAPKKLVVAYHSACTLQHSQKITEAPKTLLKRAGFEVRTPAESHLCCGSAGVYNILQPETAGALKARKLKNLERLRPDVIAAGNIGCLTQIASGAKIPVVHMVELLDWASGGPKPAAMG
jgi:glycolate oxidase iron-sulfur subunit